MRKYPSWEVARATKPDQSDLPLRNKRKLRGLPPPQRLFVKYIHNSFFGWWSSLYFQTVALEIRMQSKLDNYWTMPWKWRSNSVKAFLSVKLRKKYVVPCLLGCRFRLRSLGWADLKLWEQSLPSACWINIFCPSIVPSLAFEEVLKRCII